MAQLFRPGANLLARLVLAGVLVVPAMLLGLALVWARSPYTTGQTRVIDQPVPFSHKHHVGDVGLDCRMCHYGVEIQAHAIIPPTHVCMTCHSQLWTNAQMLAPVRASLATGDPLRWERVYALPGYAYFDHHVHVRGGVPCAACHGALETMPLTRQVAPLTMQWCISCHRDPEPRLVPAAREYTSHPYDRPIGAGDARAIHAHVQALNRAKLTDCTTCHR